MQDSISHTDYVDKRGKRLTVHPKVVGILLAITLGASAVYWGIIQAKQPSSPVSAPETQVQAKAVTALGRLEPRGEVIKLSVSNAQDSRVNQLMVQEGDWVNKGQVIAILQGLDKKQAELTESQHNVEIYRAKLAQINAGEAKVADIAAQKATIARLEAQLRTETAEREADIARMRAALKNAQLNYRRYQTLHQSGAVETSALDDRRETFEMAQADLHRAKAQLDNTVSTLRQQLRQERALLSKLKEVRPVDRREAQAELKASISTVARIKAELEDFYVRVPVAGRILKINTHIGEQVNTSEGIVELGRTDQMYAIAEVYETDVGQVQPGQRATVISEHGGFEGQVQGTVDHVGMQIKKQDVLDSDPAADKDARVVEVNVRLDPEDSNKVSSLTNLQVRITVDLESQQEPS